MTSAAFSTLNLTDSLSYLQNLHLKTTIRCGTVWHLEGLNKGLCELLYHGKDEDFGCTLKAETKVKAKTPIQSFDTHINFLVLKHLKLF